MRIFIVHVAIPQGLKTYILGSIRDPALIYPAALANKCIFEVKAADAPEGIFDAEPGARTCGSLISWDSLDQRVILKSFSCSSFFVTSRQRQCVPSLAALSLLNSTSSPLFHV